MKESLLLTRTQVLVGLTLSCWAPLMVTPERPTVELLVRTSYSFFLLPRTRKHSDGADTDASRGVLLRQAPWEVRP